MQAAGVWQDGDAGRQTGWRFGGLMCRRVDVPARFHLNSMI